MTATTMQLDLFDGHEAAIQARRLHTRTAIEEARKHAALDRFEHTHRDMLGCLRAAMRVLWLELARTNPGATVTADDARIVYEALVPARRREELLRLNPKANNWRGSIFQPKCWVWTGEYWLSEADGSHNNPLKRWRYVAGFDADRNGGTRVD